MDSSIPTRAVEEVKDFFRALLALAAAETDLEIPIEQLPVLFAELEERFPDIVPPMHFSHTQVRQSDIFEVAFLCSCDFGRKIVIKGEQPYYVETPQSAARVHERLVQRRGDEYLASLRPLVALFQDRLSQSPA